MATRFRRSADLLGSTWRALGRAGRAYFAAFLALLVTLLAITIWWSPPVDDDARWRSLVSDVVLSVLASFLFAFLLELRSTAEVLRRRRSVARLFGIDSFTIRAARDSNQEHRIAIVLPAFHLLPKGQRDMSSSPAPAITTPTHFPFGMPQNCAKSMIDLGDHATLVKRDATLATEVAHLLSDAGVVQPLIVDDYRFVLGLLQPVGGHGPRRIRTSDDNFAVSTAIVIGLWSNLVTAAIGGSKRFAELTLDGDPYDSSARSLQVGEDHLGTSISRASDVAPPHRETAVVIRMKFVDMNVIVLGGLTSLGTARLGDYLLRDKGWADIASQLAENEKRPKGSKRRSIVEAEHGYWALISCPPTKLAHARASLRESGTFRHAPAAALSVLLEEQCPAPVATASSAMLVPPVGPGSAHPLPRPPAGTVPGDPLDAGSAR